MLNQFMGFYGTHWIVFPFENQKLIFCEMINFDITKILVCICMVDASQMRKNGVKHRSQ